MVRRWSFIGRINKSLYASYIPLHHYLVDTNVNSVMYLRKSHSFFTKTRRRSWARRKHLYNWLVGASLLKFWAKRYRIYRNMHKFIQNVFLMRTSFVTFGVFFNHTRLLQVLRQSSDLSVSFTTKTLFRSYVNSTLWTKLPLLHYSYVAPLFVSAKSSELSSSTLTLFETLGFCAYSMSNSLVSEVDNLKLQVRQQHARFLTELFLIFINKIKFLYRTCVLFVLFSLN